MTPISFFVHGIPSPGGSKNAFALKKDGVYTGRAVVFDAGGKKTKAWRSAVAVYARQHAPAALCEQPLAVAMTFHMPRPKAHFRSNGMLKPAFAGLRHLFKPDVLKLARSTEDAMTGIIYRDDSATVHLSLTKLYSDGPIGCQISISSLDQPQNQNHATAQLTGPH